MHWMDRLTGLSAHNAGIPDHVPEKLPRRLLPFIWYFVSQVKWPLGLAFVLVTISNVAYATIPFFIKMIVDTLAGAQGWAEVWPELGVILGLFIAIPLLLSSLTDELDGAIKYHTLPVLLNLMRRQLAAYMHGHAYAYFQEDFAGRLSSKVIETPHAVRFVIEVMSYSFWYILVTFLTSIVLFGLAHWTMLLVIIPYGVIYITWLLVCMPAIMDKSQRANEDQSYVRGRYVDTLSNILQVKLFARSKHEDAYLTEALKDHTYSMRRMNFAIWRTYIGLEVLNILLWIASLGMSLYGWANGWLSTGDIAMILPICLTITNQSWWMSDIFSDLASNIGQVREGMEAITQSRRVRDAPGARDLEVKEGHIAFSHIRFGYGQTPLFRQLDLDIAPGERVGLVGTSGAGKTSLISLLLRLYDLDDGRIDIDRQDIAQVRQDSLRDQIAVIPQMSDLLHRSIADNIAYGRPGATREDVINAARSALAHDFIKDLRDAAGRTGYDAHVGERGVKLSGGQRQRIAIARAILKDAPILVLDEATSSLDSESEQAIQQGLRTAMEGKTVIAIAHRLSTLANMNRVIVMDHGAIVEEGSHDTLLRQNGIYAKLWKIQSGEFLHESKEGEGNALSYERGQIPPATT